MAPMDEPAPADVVMRAAALLPVASVAMVDAPAADCVCSSAFAAAAAAADRAELRPTRPEGP